MLRYAIKNSVVLCWIPYLITGVEAFEWLGELLGLVVLIGFFFTLGKSKQALHDMIAKTAVYPEKYQFADRFPTLSRYLPKA